MIKFIPLLTVALATWLIAFPVTAATVFENGTLLDTDSNILINQNQSVSNKFSLSHAIDLTSVTLGLWSRRDGAPAQLDWSIGSMAFSADQGAGTATFQTITTAFYVDNFEVDFATFSLNLPLNAGDYWLTLKNGLSDAGSDISWDVSGGPAIAQFQHSGVIDATDSEYFRLSGNDAAGTPPPPAPVPVPVPEPTSLLLLGVGLIGCAAVRRRCTGTTA